MSSKSVPQDAQAVSAHGNIELKKMVENILASDGEIRALRAALQMKTLDILRGGDRSPIIQQTMNNNNSSRTNEASDTIALINQLILEYFEWNGYHYAREMFVLETNTQSIDADKRQRLAEHLGICENGAESYHAAQQNHPRSTEHLPLLLHIMTRNNLNLNH